MSRRRRIGHRGSFATVALVVLGALATAGLASAASGSIHVKATEKAITITGSRSTAKQVIQISYDPKKCASFPTEYRRSVQFSDLHAKKSGAFKYIIRLSKLPFTKPLPHYACVYLLSVKGSSIKSVASASARFS